MIWAQTSPDNNPKPGRGERQKLQSVLFRLVNQVERLGNGNDQPFKLRQRPICRNQNLRDGKKFKFEFENAGTMQAALDLLSGPLNGTLRVNVKWNEPKKKFLKKRTSY